MYADKPEDIVHDIAEDITVLSVDDETYVRQNIAAYLEDSGFKVIQAGNGREGLEAYRRETPDIMLLDLHMPDMDGFKVLEIMKNEFPSTPVIIVSGTGTIQAAIKATRLGAWDIVLKPIQDMSVVEYAVRKAWERATLLRENQMYRESLEEQVRKRTAELERQGTELKVINERLTSEISERKLAQEEVNRLNTDLEVRVKQRTAQLEVANRELEAFSYSVSHDLRGPLRHIDAYARILQTDYSEKLDDDAIRCIQKINTGCQKMNSLVNDLLHLAQVSGGELKVNEVNLSKIAHLIFEDLHMAHKEREVTVKVQENVLGKGDSGLLRIALENLLGNAWKYTLKNESEQKNTEIEFGEMETERGRAYFIKDNGAGFDMNFAGKLFGAFQRLHSQEEFEGTGIGLATVQRIIHRHGGLIWADSRPREGASFFFTLGA